jgi:2-keto-4-pentenoate hydratase/2-oxohepta-3-ene-1,7-dioic acid hydratase in catechol pathway
MKLANLGGRAVLVTDAGAIDIAEATAGEFGPSPQVVFDRWEAFVPAAAGIDAEPVDYAPERLGPPSPTPRQVFAIGLNYKAHAEETGQQVPEIPATFTKFPSALNGPYGTIELPAGTVDWEVELVVVIGREAADVERARAWEHVAGLTVGQDISERVTQMAAGRQFCLGKSFRTFAPTGPWMVSVDEVADRDDLALGCALDGETLQASRTSDLIFPVDELIARLSAIVTLYPGDLIFTGTPSGVGAARKPPRFLADGQVLETWIEGIGRLRNPIRKKGA